MSVRLSISVLRPILTIVVSTAFLVAPVRGDDKPATALPPAAQAKDAKVTIPAQASGPAVQRDGLMRLEEDLSRALRMFKPENEIQMQPPTQVPAARPQSVPALRGKRTKDLQRREKDWMLMNPDNASGVPDFDDLLKFPDPEADGQAKKSSSSPDPYSDSLDPRLSAKRKLKSPVRDELTRDRKGQNGEKDDESEDDSKLPAGLREANREMKKQLGSNSSKTAKAPGRGFWSDVFGFGNMTLTPEQEKAHHDVMKEFQEKILYAPATPSADNAILNAVNGTAPGLQSLPASGLPTTDTHAPGYDAQLGTVNPAMASGAFQDPTARALNQWNPYATTPKSQPAQLAPPQPIFEVPRRKFQ